MPLTVLRTLIILNIVFALLLTGAVLAGKTRPPALIVMLTHFDDYQSPPVTTMTWIDTDDGYPYTRRYSGARWTDEVNCQMYLHVFGELNSTLKIVFLNGVEQA